MNSSRNIFVFGFSIFTALVIPNWVMKNPDFFKTGVFKGSLFVLDSDWIAGDACLFYDIPLIFSLWTLLYHSGVEVLDQVINILLSTHMFVGGFLGFFLDNTVPGNEKLQLVWLWIIINISFTSGLLLSQGPNVSVASSPLMNPILAAWETSVKLKKCMTCPLE